MYAEVAAIAIPARPPFQRRLSSWSPPESADRNTAAGTRMMRRPTVMSTIEENVDSESPVAPNASTRSGGTQAS